MKDKTSKKLKFLISISYKHVEAIINPEPNHPKFKIIRYELPLFIVPSIHDLINFLLRYTDIGKYCNNDFLQLENEFKSDITKVIDIIDFLKFKKEVLDDIPKHFIGSYYLEENYVEKRVAVYKLPIETQKLHINEDLF
ncbi:hypothetical protein [Elizabethkingia anophelis]|uniref:hypothetical protein n=1 Tax=Elizabethkingia anophelis TaxID=1117645 RepID=UPI0024E19C16|nr:hypothetical protein [Elizabethkingia anophelis]MCT4162103.1 hypothetical protein [Elizabethkingia anophelis]CAH1144112.1 hypothetical protein EAVNVB490_01641 [Elizabethkingia anophelis]CAI9670564.1 hypothetical protein EAVNNN508_01640 [Elizabethkingia anophelis]CAI9673160.1 hypothetical protein EAVNVB490_00522 [Elizabethkingia anophelis]CAI9677995.1 hypothetical protein EAVNNN508_00520 [Elizabethkingia anophelis]